MAWLEETQHLLDTRSRILTFEVISRETRLSTAWLGRFSRERNGDFGIKKVHTLHSYLRKQKEMLAVTNPRK